MNSTLFELKNLELNNGLTRKLKAWRKSGLSYRTIAKRLSVSGATVTHETIASWCRALGIDVRA
jgi:transposase-like protein